MINLRSVLSNSPRSVKNLVFYPSLFIFALLVLSIGRYCNPLATVIFVLMFSEGVVSVLSRNFVHESEDFRSIWVEYKFQVMYLISVGISYCLIAFLYSYVGFYSLFVYAVCFCVFRLYFFEVSDLIKEKNLSSPSTQLISQMANEEKLNVDMNAIRSKSRSQNLKRFKAILFSSSIDNDFKSKILDKAEFSSWFASMHFAKQSYNIFSEDFTSLDPLRQVQRIKDIEKYL